MRNDRFEFETTSGYYTTEEKKSLESGCFEQASETCRGRHSSRGISEAYRRCLDLRFNANGIPRTLDRLCLKLRIRYLKESNPACLKGARARNFQNVIVKQLASLPNAENYQEENWLDTPELWPFVNLDLIRDVTGDHCENLRDELQWRMESWCDRWIPLSSTTLHGMKNIPEDIYLFPSWEDIGSRSIPRSRKRFLGDNTFLAYSQASIKKEPVSVSESVRSKVIELSKNMSIGYTSFKCGITVADVVAILKENREQFQKSM